MTWADIARSIILGQTILIVALTLANVALTLALQRPRPERTLGVIFTTASYACASLYVSLDTIVRFGKQPTHFLWLALGTVASGCLGLSLLIAHSLFNTGKGVRIVKRWFKH